MRMQSKFVWTTCTNGKRCQGAGRAGGVNQRKGRLGKMGGFGNLESPLIKTMKAAFEVYEETLESSFLKLEQEIEANEPNARKRRLWLKVRLGFPALYIAGLQELPYPRMFMMCFSTDGTNSAMWEIMRKITAVSV